jgi:hypothetical protein
MNLTDREIWTLIHGMILGAIYLLGFAGGLAELYSYNPTWLTRQGIRERVFRLDLGIGVMTVVSWLTVIVGTWIVYPWYRAPLPRELAEVVSAAQRGATALTHEQFQQFLQYPRYFLLADPTLAGWHAFGMEWKEHVAWISPILTTVVFFAVIYYGRRLAFEPGIRHLLIAVYVLAFLIAAVAGVFGALITKTAPLM